MTTTGALAMLCGMFVIWPGIAFFIGYQVGRRRLRVRSPFYRGEREEFPVSPGGTDSPVRVAGRSALGRLRQ
jgi:hypothetical protein